MKKYLLIILLLTVQQLVHAQLVPFQTKFEKTIPVLNVATFHMGHTSDATRTAFNPKDPERVKEVHALAKRFAAFKPTVLVLENVPSRTEALQAMYYAYLKNPQMTFEHPSEIELLAFEVGRLAGVKKVYGIDYKKGYNYRIYGELEKKADSITYNAYWKLVEKNTKNYMEKLNREPTVMDHFQMNNSKVYLDFLMNVNADMLLYASSPEGNEGAFEAAKFYERNLIMFSNFNKIPLSADDRVFLLMGGTHSAFFRQWLERSPKYHEVDVLPYLK